jgi:ParB family chromosome partitioning protein
VPGTEGPATLRCPITTLRVSQYQPAGRPSSRAIEAVSRAIETAGSLEQLMRRQNGVFETLDHEARDLVKLAADIAAHGVESPLEARQTRDGIELLAGHRRLVAARLAGLSEVPVRMIGPLSEHEAAGFVLRRNRLRADFSTWHEAVLLRSLQQRRRDAGLGGDSVRALAGAMAYSIGRVSELLAIGRAFPPAVVRAVGAGNEALAEEALTRLSYRSLRALIKVMDLERRVALTRRALGLTPDAADDASNAGTVRESSAVRVATRRDGGFTLSVQRPIHTLRRDDAEQLLHVLTGHIESVRRRLQRP